jgi:hypothetical protein
MTKTLAPFIMKRESSSINSFGGARTSRLLLAAR